MMSLEYFTVLIVMCEFCYACKLRAADPGDQILCRLDGGNQSVTHDTAVACLFRQLDKCKQL